MPLGNPEAEQLDIFEEDLKKAPPGLAGGMGVASLEGEGGGLLAGALRLQL